MESAKVVIIGAGFAGLSAASYLVQNGLTDVILLEARNRIGGRFYVETHNGHTLHMGAQWAHGVGKPSEISQNSVFVLAKKYGLLHENMPRDGLGDMFHESFELDRVYVKGGSLVPEKYTLKAGEIYTQICNCDWSSLINSKTSVNDIFETLVKRALDDLKNEMEEDEVNFVENVLYGLFKNIFIGYAGDDLQKISANTFYVSGELPGGDLILPTSILDKMTLEIAPIGNNLKLKEKVVKIEWNENEVIVTTENQSKFKADFCICTFPPEVMKKCHQKGVLGKYTDPRIHGPCTRTIYLSFIFEN